MTMDVVKQLNNLYKMCGKTRQVKPIFENEVAIMASKSAGVGLRDAVRDFFDEDDISDILGGKIGLECLSAHLRVWKEKGCPKMNQRKT